MTREVEFLSNDRTNPDTNNKTLTKLALTLTDHHDAFESFCAPVFCDFVRNYSCTVDGAVVTSKGKFAKQPDNVVLHLNSTGTTLQETKIEKPIETEAECLTSAKRASE